ncbi:hypothetical protein IscW_ISCW014842, partial [Ixodes scapularis]
ECAWDHCKSEDNPADLLTRGVSPPFLLHTSTCWAGPKWLALPKLNWPTRFSVSNSAHEVDIPEQNKFIL